MKRFTRARLIGSLGIVVATAAGTAMAAAPAGIATGKTPATNQQTPATNQSAPPAGQQGPSTCEGMTGSSTSDGANPSEGGNAGVSDLSGIEALVADALSQVCLSDQQRTAVEQLATDVTPKERTVSDARHAFITALAEQLRTGSIDQNGLKPQIDALVNAHEAASPALRKALEDLHGILDPGQRKAFVDALESRMKDIGSASSGWFDSLSTNLGLSDEQKQSIRTVLDMAQSDLQQERGQTKAVFDAFQGNDFSVEKIDPESQVGPRVRAEADAMAAVAKHVSDILTPEQRTKLADDIENKAAGGTQGGEQGGSQGATPSGTPGTAPGGVAPSEGAPSQAAPSEGAPSEMPSTGSEDLGNTDEGLFIGRGFRRGFVRGWGGGFYGGRGFYRSARFGYFGGYPFIGGWGPGVW